MKMVAKHCAPIYPGEDIMEPPGFDDPRLKPWLEQLVQLKVMSDKGVMLKAGHMMRGISPAGYLWRLEWEE